MQSLDLHDVTLKLRFNNLLMTTTNDGDTPTVERTEDGVIRINTDLNPRLILLPAVGATTGLAVGNAESFCIVTSYLSII
jgi:hypothetical protein